MVSHRGALAIALILAGAGGASGLKSRSLAQMSSGASDQDLAPVSQGTLDNSTDFTGDTAFSALCSFYQPRVRSKQYNKAGCVRGCSTLTIDCNTGDDDGIIDVTYTRSKFVIGTMSTKYGVYKKHRGAHGRHMLFKYFGGRIENGVYTGGEPKMESCLPWMRDASSWCEGPKWTKSEDEKIKVSAEDIASWSMTYMWIRWDNEMGQYVLEEDAVKGSKMPDVVEVKGMQLHGLGDGVGTMGPQVPGWYTVGVHGWTQACLDNDKPKGTDLPITDDKVCDIHVWKVFPESGSIVSTGWRTTHYATDEKKSFA